MRSRAPPTPSTSARGAGPPIRRLRSLQASAPAAFPRRQFRASARRIRSEVPLPRVGLSMTDTSGLRSDEGALASPSAPRRLRPGAVAALLLIAGLVAGTLAAARLA